MNLLTPPSESNQLVDGPRLLELLFDAQNRPCLRWLGYQRSRRTIPYLKIGRLIRYDPRVVRQALDERCSVRAR